MLIQIFRFCERHLPYIQVFRPEHFEDIDYLIDNELSFVYCICYVTARYLPGGKELREMLLPEVIRVPKAALTTQVGGRPVDDLSTLKALFILYVYSDLTPPSQPSESSPKQDILFWPLKSVVEVYAVRLSLHRSVQDLKSELRSNPEGITTSKSYERYTYWLWLFSTAH